MLLQRFPDLDLSEMVGVSLNMRRLNAYIATVSTGACVLGALVYYASPTVDSSSLMAVLLLCLLALAAELLAFALPRSADGSVAFIPYLACCLVVPSWPTVAAVAGMRVILEAGSKRVFHKSLFNTAQQALTLSLAILAYRALGGTSLVGLSSTSLASATRMTALPALLACTAALVLNQFIVSTAIALSSEGSISKIWRANTLATIGLDLVAAPLVFVFAWIYTRFGPVAAAASWVPILGIRQVYKMNLELEQMNEELLQLMVKSIEARDPYTSGHSRRVQHYSVLIARSLGMNAHEEERVSRAALLHDVGKIHEKYAPILRKPEKLSADEWATMQEHPIDGANLVGTISKLRETIPAIRHHHENWDGTGYPDRLVGDAIPLAARIIAFADTIDAMTSERPYRKLPLSEEAVRAEIIRCRGSRFDPEMTDRLLASSAWRQVFDAQAKVGGAPARLLKLLDDSRAARTGTS